jgi:hypothetical protein
MTSVSFLSRYNMRAMGSATGDTETCNIGGGRCGFADLEAQFFGDGSVLGSHLS